MSSFKSIIEDLVAALSYASDLHNQDERLKAYARANIDFSALTLDAIRAADQTALSMELGRRVSRS